MEPGAITDKNKRKEADGNHRGDGSRSRQQGRELGGVVRHDDLVRGVQDTEFVKEKRIRLQAGEGVPTSQTCGECARRSDGDVVRGIKKRGVCRRESETRDGDGAMMHGVAEVLHDGHQKGL